MIPMRIDYVVGTAIAWEQLSLEDTDSIDPSPFASDKGIAKKKSSYLS